jgi:hypothetical protein
MNREGHESADFFVGTEVEHTPAYGMKTLFVIGLHHPEVIRQRLTADIEHIYFGANQSFPYFLGEDIQGWADWQNMIVDFLPDYWCTLDLDVSQVEDLVGTSLTGFSNFIPMISVKLPYINQLGYNATLKLDDRDFADTNPGVWCHSIHELQDRSKFTDWSKYTKDEVIE